MSDLPDTTQDQNSQTTTDQSAPKGDAPAPGSTDTSSSTTDQQNDAGDDDASLLGGKPDGDGADDAGDDKGDKTDGDDAGDDSGDTAALFGAPADDAAYEITGLPDGVTLDAGAIAAVTPLARELNLSNEGLSKLAGVYAESVLPGVVSQVQTQMTDQINADVAELRKSWATEARTAVVGGKAEDGTVIAPDPIYQGKTLKEVQGVAAKAIDRFAGPEFREFVDQNGLGNHPSLLRFAFLAGSAISEDTSFENGAGASAAPKTREQKYYNR